MARADDSGSDYAAWKPLAEHTREALELLGYGVPRCLPDEPDACGGDYAHHTLGHLAALKAVVDHHLAHLGEGSAPLVADIYAQVATGLEGTCEQGHQFRLGDVRR